jgi:COP9 signalosome complex subunit 1
MGDSRATLDLDAYAARYEGRGRVQRLRFVAWRSPTLQLDALRLAIDAAKAGKDTTIYKELVAHAGGRLGGAYALDEEWVAATDQAASRELERLRRELDEHRQQTNMEVIRAGHNDLGDFFFARGKLSNARGEFITMRDYCKHSNHHMSMCMKVILVCIEAGEFHNVENYVHMAENTPDATKLPLQLVKMRFCAGLALIIRGRYLDAANRFLSTSIDMSEDKAPAIQALLNDVFSIEDIATYAGLCALATLSRSALLSRVLGNAEFCALLELVPDIREMITDFCSTRYTSCLALLEKLRPDLLLDPFLGRDEHVNNLYSRIRSKSLVQYVAPFESVDLTRMAEVFSTDLTLLMGELYELIEGGQIKARIDSENKSLHRKNLDLRRSALANALSVGQTAFDDAETMLLRMDMTKCGLSIAAWSSSSGINRNIAELGPRGVSGTSVADTLYDDGTGRSPLM